MPLCTLNAAAGLLKLRFFGFHVIGRCVFTKHPFRLKIFQNYTVAVGNGMESV